jgi:small-conductance mechanosensitive channel
MDLATLPEWAKAALAAVSEPPVSTALRVGAIAIGTLILAGLANRRLRVRLLDAQQLMLLRRAVSSVIFGLGVFWILNELGVGLGPLLGAAGLLSVAIGFAAQTSVSNIISGVFLIGERPFVVGDLIEVAGTRGFVVSVELLSIKLRTLDNLMVRIPNESMLKSNLFNYTHFPIRRVDVVLPVPHDVNLERLETLLMDLAAEAPLALAEPEALFIISDIAPSAINLQLSVWGLTDDWLNLKNDLIRRIQALFAAEGIAVAVPRVAISQAAQPEVPPTVQSATR